MDTLEQCYCQGTARTCTGQGIPSADLQGCEESLINPGRRLTSGLNIHERVDLASWTLFRSPSTLIGCAEAYLNECLNWNRVEFGRHLALVCLRLRGSRIRGLRRGRTERCFGRIGSSPPAIYTYLATCSHTTIRDGSPMESCIRAPWKCTGVNVS